MMPSTPNTCGYDVVLDLPFGRFGLLFSADRIWEMAFLPPDTPLRPAIHPIAIEAVARIEKWLATPQTCLVLPLHQRGTPFQQRVWEAIRTVPSGQVTTYGTLATQLGSAPRAVGQACGSNPFPLATPCHRIVSATGLGGFSHASDGFLLQIKRWLLHNEGYQ